MNLEENRRVNLVSTLRSRGFQVVIPAFGLCSYAAIYCRDQRIPDVARASVDIAGVDFAVYKDGAAVVVDSDRGQARIESSDEGLKYIATSGDPLALGPFGHEFKTDKTWFAQTADHIYPDAVPNIYKSLFTPRVQHTADVLISLKDGYYYGWSPFGRFVKLLATHGNALQSSSNAFLMSTHREFPAYVRADDAKVLLRG